MTTEKKLIIYTDGASLGNPGKGGYGIVMKWGNARKEISEGFTLTTNNRMELMGAIEGLRALKRPCTVTVWTDSEYVKKGMTEWLPGWKKNGWRRKEKGSYKPVKNQELWQRLDALLAKHQVRFTLVRGHQGHVENERCDVLAVAAAREFA